VEGRGNMETTISADGPKTYADYQKLAEGEPYQLINGMFVKSPSPVTNHQRLIKRIEWALIPLEKKGIGELLYAPLDVYFSDTEVYQPDIIFIARDNELVEIDKIVTGAPDIVIEVLSPSTAYYDLRHKAKVYAESGVKEYWIVDPGEKSVEIFSNSKGSFTLEQKAEGDCAAESKLFPEVNIELGELFREM
jgi:Uma2 family endonuclease